MHRYVGLIGVLALFATACGEDPAGLGKIDASEDAGGLKLDAGLHPDATANADATTDADGSEPADVGVGDATPDAGNDDAAIGDSGPRSPQTLFTPVSGGGLSTGAAHRMWIAVGGAAAQGAGNGSHRVVFGPPLPRR